MNKLAISSILPTLSLILLSACATSPGGLRATYTPDAVHSSTKKPKDVAVCIADAWEKDGGPIQVGFRPMTNGYSVNYYITTTGDIHYLADITDVPTGSQTKAWSYKNLTLGFKDPHMDIVTNCQL